MPTCLCEVLRPITAFCQCLGFLPLKYKHEACSKSSPAEGAAFMVSPKTSNDIGLGSVTDTFASNCGHHFNFRQISLPSFFDFIWAANFTATAFWVHIHVPAAVQWRYKGIDLYVIYVQIFTTYYELVLILLLARWKAKEIALTWAKIGEIFITVKTNFKNPSPKQINLSNEGSAGFDRYTVSLVHV